MRSNKKIITLTISILLLFVFGNFIIPVTKGVDVWIPTNPSQETLITRFLMFIGIIIIIILLLVVLILSVILIKKHNKKKYINKTIHQRDVKENIKSESFYCLKCGNKVIDITNEYCSKCGNKIIK